MCSRVQAGLQTGLVGPAEATLVRATCVQVAAASIGGSFLSAWKDGGRDRDRTCDPYHVKVVLFR
jgi:hypothetical protein